jgi:hypothetical protein
MIDKKQRETIINLGKELEEIVKKPETDESTKQLIAKAMEFAYNVKGCEDNYDMKNDPYNASNCIKIYERIKNLLGIQNGG